MLPLPPLSHHSLSEITVLSDLPVEPDAFFEQSGSRSSFASNMQDGAQTGQCGSSASLIPQGAGEPQALFQQWHSVCGIILLECQPPGGIECLRPYRG